MKAVVVVELDIADLGDLEPGPLDAWLWALERQVEELKTVNKANVKDAWVEPELFGGDQEPPQDRLQVHP